jgi:opacity protein-like surface antigen
MKRLSVTLFAFITAFMVSNAQFTKFGGGLGFTSGYHFHDVQEDYNKSGNINLFLKGIYEINLPVHISPSITFFIPHVYKDPNLTGGEEYKSVVNTLMIDINGHYVFNSLDKIEFYGLAGIDILLAWKKDVYDMLDLKETFKESDNAFGLNLGVGSYIKLTEQMDLSVEAKYLVSKYSQFMVNAGVLLNLQWLSKHENPEY